MITLIFLDANGVGRLPEPEELEEVTISVAAGQISKESVTAWMRRQMEQE
jgi:prophage maintenance system killer protein